MISKTKANKTKNRIESINDLQHLLWKEYLNELKYYLSYHQHPWNWRLHAICVPIEWLGYYLFLSLLHIHLIIALPLSLYLIALPSKIAFISSIGNILFALIANKLYHYLKNWVSTLLLAFAIQGVAWLIQIFIGHQIIEKNVPGFTKQLTLNSILVSLLLSWDAWTPISQE